MLFTINPNLHQSGQRAVHCECDYDSWDAQPASVCARAIGRADVGAEAEGDDCAADASAEEDDGDYGDNDPVEILEQSFEEVFV